MPYNIEISGIKILKHKNMQNLLNFDEKIGVICYNKITRGDKLWIIY